MFVEQKNEFNLAFNCDQNDTFKSEPLNTNSETLIRLPEFLTIPEFGTTVFLKAASQLSKKKSLMLLLFVF